MSKKRRPIKGAEVFYGAEEPKTPVPERRQNIKTERLNDVKTERLKVGRERVNYYLNPHLLETLDKVQAEVRSLTKRKISKSDIVGIAIEEALKEFQEKKERSKLFRGLTE